MRIVRKGNPIKERTYLVLIDVFILMCAMGVSLGILFITLNPEFGLLKTNKSGYQIPYSSKIRIPMSEFRSREKKLKNFHQYAEFEAAVNNEGNFKPVKLSDGLKYFQGRLSLKQSERQLIQAEKDSHNKITGTLYLILNPGKNIDRINDNDSVTIRINYLKGFKSDSSKGYGDWIQK